MTRTLLILILFLLPVAAQEKPKTPDAPSKPAEYTLTKEELAQLQEFRESLKLLNDSFAKVNAKLDAILTEEQKVAAWDLLVLTRKQNTELQAKAQAWENDLRKSKKCATCVIQGDKFVEQPEKK